MTSRVNDCRVVIKPQKSSNTDAFDEIRSQRRKRQAKKLSRYKFNQLSVHCLHIKENEEGVGLK